MGTSMAGGYVNREGNITDWLNELAFVPVDYRCGAPADEWSGDLGCGVQYFSQQGVARLAKQAGIDFPEDMPLPVRLKEVQAMFDKGDERTKKIFETIGVCFGCTIARYFDFYDVEKLFDACHAYFKKTGRRISFEYAMIDGVNDTVGHAKELLQLLKGLPSHVNLIPLNTVKERNLFGVNEDQVRAFLAVLEKRHISATRRREMGDDIEGACGQLRKKVMEEKP